MTDVQTGIVEADDLGRTLTHEHMNLNYKNFYKEPPTRLKNHLEGDICLENVGFVQHYPYSNRRNVEFYTDDVKEAVLEDLKIFRDLEGSAIVENTTHGLERNAGFLLEASKETGVHVVAGTGFYLAQVQPYSLLGETVEHLCDVMRTDLTIGCSEKPEVKCGVIGEVASDYPIHPFERNVIRATGILQEELECPVTFHPGRNPKSPFEIMRLYAEAGGNEEKAVMSHLDSMYRTCMGRLTGIPFIHSGVGRNRTLDASQMLEFASEFKCFLQHDLFGTEVLIYQLSPTTHMPSDFQRLERIKLLCEEGHIRRILMSHDIHTKHRLAKFGGHGYFHLFANVSQKITHMGMNSETFDEITIANPRRWLSWNPK